MMTCLRCITLSALWGVAFSLVFSVLVCFGVDPETRWVSDSLSPLLGIWCGTSWVFNKEPAAKPHAWKRGAGVGIFFVLLWLGFWFYIEDRFNPLGWWNQALPRLTVTHLFWWIGTVVTAIAAARFGANAPRLLVRAQVVYLTLIFAGAGCLSQEADNNNQSLEVVPGCELRQWPIAMDGTVVRLLTFDFNRQPGFKLGVYDCARDDPMPDTDFNTTYMGQSLSGLASRLNREAKSQGRQLVCLSNGGFFGARGLGAAQHQEPIVQNGQPHYPFDLMRPREQTWFFAFQPLIDTAPQARFQLLPRMSQPQLKQFSTVLGGVRPLRVNGKSLALTPGAGGTTLKCSRTSVGWSADGNKFFLLSVLDPDGELASGIQKKMGWRQTGGWDVPQVQKFWEERQVPFAVLFDGGESTQLAHHQNGNFSYVLSGYHYAFTLGYLFQRPLQFTLPILPPEESHRGVLNYLYVDGPHKN